MGVYDNYQQNIKISTNLDGASTPSDFWVQEIILAISNLDIAHLVTFSIMILMTTIFLLQAA